jgi:hypothetical protein
MVFKLVSANRVYTFDCNDSASGAGSVSTWIAGVQNACPWVQITQTDEKGSTKTSAAETSGAYGIYKSRAASAAGKGKQGKLGKGKKGGGEWQVGELVTGGDVDEGGGGDGQFVVAAVL